MIKGFNLMVDNIKSYIGKLVEKQNEIEELHKTETHRMNLIIDEKTENLKAVMEELMERRMFQNNAIGQCYRLLQELQYSIEVLPVDIEKYARFVEVIEKEIYLLKGWRKKDNKLKKGIL